MSAKTIALLVGLNTLISVALLALSPRWLSPAPALAVLDVAELYRLKESQVAALLVSRSADDAERTRALEQAAAFGTEMNALLAALPGECRCIVLARGAVVGAATELPDLTPELRRRLGL